MNMQSDIAKPDVFAQAEYWFVRLRAENCSPQEQMAFRQWRADPACAEAFTATEALWHEVGDAKAHPDIERLSNNVLAETAPPPIPSPASGGGLGWGRLTRRPLALAAGVAAIAFALSVALLYDPSAYTTGLGEQRTVALSDGSTVILNTDTRIEVDFTEDMRRLSLVHGEALFDVAKDSERPFLVAAGDNWVMALGTRFQVRRDSDRVEVTLLEGRVRVDKALPSKIEDKQRTTDPSTGLPRMPEPILMEPGEQVTIAKASEEIVRERIQDEQAVVSWTNGRLIFRATPLDEAVAEINRYARTKIRVADPRLRDLPISGTFVTGDSEILVAALEAEFPVRAEKTGRHEIVLRKK